MFFLRSSSILLLAFRSAILSTLSSRWSMSVLKTCESWNTEENYQEWHNTASKDKVGRSALLMQDEECLNSSKQNMCRTPCLSLSVAWRIITSREILKNNRRMKGNLDEPPCWASMKNSSNKRMIERKRSWKYKVKPCNDLVGASRQDNAKNLELQKRKDETLEPRITSSWTISGRKELNHLEEIRIRFIVCLSFIKLNWWQAMDLAYYLFL